MMNPILSTALSGLQAATKRVSVSANNVANAQTSRPASSPEGVFRAQRVVARSVPGGGVATSVQDKAPATVTGPDPSVPGGVSVFPNVDFVAEAVDQTLALASYRANAAVIRVQQEIDDALLDIET
jgi:flagellar basal-body rod protein FlgC